MLPRTTKKFIENNKKEKMKTIMFVEYIIETLTVLCTPLLKTVIRSYFFVVGDTFSCVSRLGLEGLTMLCISFVVLMVDDMDVKATINLLTGDGVTMIKCLCHEMVP